MGIIQILVIWYVFINVFAFLAYGVDKKKAQAGAYRISEKFLLSLSVVGGGIGSYAGMQTFRHKTKKIVFNIWVPLWIVIHIIIIIRVTAVPGT